MKTYLLSTVVAPSFASAMITVTDLTRDEFLSHLAQVDVNLCGHPVTNQVLREVCRTLPEPCKEFWQGDGIAIAARPRGGVRGARVNGDAQVSLDDLEFCRIEYALRDV
jgi:hypothetical protein